MRRRAVARKVHSAGQRPHCPTFPGDVIYLSEAPDGVRLSAANPEFEAQMELAEQIMREDRDILRVLAK